MSTTPDFKKTLQNLREQFIRGSAERLARIGGALERLEADETDVEAVRELGREFHGFSGLGGTYGFPQVTALGLEGERQCDAFLSSATAPGGADLTAWRSLLGALREQILGTPAARPPGKPVLDMASSSGKSVLLVGEDAEVSGPLTRLAERDGFALKSASTCAAARCEIARDVPLLLLVEVGLTDGSGLALVEEIRSMPGCAEIPILVLSGLASVLDRVEAIHCGADGLLEKPIDWEALSQRVHRLLERPSGETPRVLSVEDDPDQGAYLQAVLETAGYQVRVVTDAAQFEAALIAFRPDIVLMDILLPGVSGYDLVRCLRQDSRYATLPVLFLTTEQQLHVRIEAVKAGGDDHLVKPVAPGLLLSTVAARIERARILRDLVERDGLTGLLTHTAFLERVRVAISRLQRHPDGLSLALVLLDLDHFKRVNDTYGHPVGDRVLASLAAVLKRRLRQTDTIGRMGGEEFGVLLEDLTREDTTRLLTRLLAEFSAIEHKAADGQTFAVTFSAGVAMFERGTTDLNRWFETADRALYAAKNAGRARVIAV